MVNTLWNAAIYRRFSGDSRPISDERGRTGAHSQTSQREPTNTMKSGNTWPHAKLKWLAVTTVLACLWSSSVPGTEPPTKTREIFVPISDLKVLLESEPHRVLLTRHEYDELVKKAKKSPETHAPHASVIVAADYDIAVDDGRTKLLGKITLDILDDGLQAVPLDVGGVGLLAAKLDDQPAPIGFAADGRLNLLVSGRGRHRLTLEMLAPLEMNSAQQFLSFRLPTAVVGRWKLAVPGDVEIKSGADVVSREVASVPSETDKEAKRTRFELLPRPGNCEIRMSLNSHLQRREQAVASRCVLFDEVTEAYEKLHASVTCWILHRAIDRVRFVVPDGFEITEINSPAMARWDVETEAGRKVVNVRLREQTTDTVVLSVTATRAPSQLKSWRMPRLELLDVVGQVTVVGLLVEDGLKTESLTASDLIPVDTGVLATALPATLVRPEPGAVPLRYIAAYYAPQPGFELKGDFRRAPAALAVTTNLLLSVQDQGCEVQGGFALVPTAEKRFRFDFSVPAGWSVVDVTGPDKVPLAIERYENEKTSPRVHVKLPQGISPGQTYMASFRARYTPPGWLNDWKSQVLDFPMFRVLDAGRDEGAVAVVVDEDMEVRPEKVDRLVPITQAEMARFGLAAGAMNLAYRYENSGGRATIAVDRTKSRATARTFAFFQIVPEVLKAHYVVIYSIEDAKTARLALLLPDTTPESLTIRGLDGVIVKDYSHEPAGAMRRWNVLLDKARRGEVRLEVDFEMRPRAIGEPPAANEATFPFPEPEKQKLEAPAPDATGKVTELKDFDLPLLTADAVVYQSGMVAIEGDLELGVEVKTDARRADVGQLAIAKYTPVSIDPSVKPGEEHSAKQPPMRLLGTYDFVGETPRVDVDVVRNPNYALTPAIIQRAKLATLLSADGASQTQATFQLRAKVPYLEVELPENASLWSAVLDGVPLKPQKRSGEPLIGLPPATANTVRNLQLVYEAPVESVVNGGRLKLFAPRLLYRASQTAKRSTEIPLVDVEWTVTVPDGYDAVATDGTLEVHAVDRPVPAPLVVAGVLYAVADGYPFMVTSSLSGSVGAKSANNLRQFGLANRNYPLGDEARSVPARRPAGPFQDNMTSELDGAQRDEAGEAKDSAPVLTKFAEAEVTQPQLAAGAKPDVPVVAPAPSAPAMPTAGPGQVMPPGPVPPAKYSKALAEQPAASSGQAPLVAPPVPSPEVKPEPAKPAEDQRDDNGSGFAGRGWRMGKSKAVYQQDNLIGFRSLKIDVQQTGMGDQHLLTFSSLGANPQIGITLARRNRTEALVWGIGLAVFVLGVGFTARPVRQKVALVVGLGVSSALLPLVYDTVSMAMLCNGVFYAASLLVPYYLIAGLVRWIVRGLRVRLARVSSPIPVTVPIVFFFAAMLLSATAQAQPQPPVVEPPVVVPGDAIIVPYDVKSKTGIRDADHLLVPYDRYVELWNRAYPDKKLEAHPAPLPYALSDASYRAVLEGEETLNVTGKIQINVLADGYVSVPLGLRGGVLARADLDGKPARLQVMNVSGTLRVPANSSGKQSMPDTSKPAAAMDATLLAIQVSGKGSHQLELEVRLKLAHVGGWRGTAGSLPMAPAATVTFRVPQPQTEVRLGQAVDHRVRETQRPDESLETALGPGGTLQLQWRPKVAEAQVDRGLTVETAALLDIQEDGLRMGLHVRLEFRRGQRESFTLTLPPEYLVEKVAGNNVRGWEVRRTAGEQTVEVSLLKTAKDTEQFNLFLSRSGKVGQAPLEDFAVPMVTVRDAALSSGQVTIRRSSLLEVRTTERSGVTRIDLGSLPDLSGGPATEESVLAIRPYEAYRFPTTPFVLRLSAAPVVATVGAEAQTSVKLDPTDPGLESKIVFHVDMRRVYRFAIALPDDLRLPEVTLPSAGIWSIEKEGQRSILKIHLQQGSMGDVAVIVRGKLPAMDTRREIAVPRLEPLGVARQEGYIAVQADPAFSVQSRELRDCQETELERVNAWLDPQLRSATRLALHYQGGSYAGKLRLVARVPEIVCDTVTNVRVTDRAIEETIILNYNIRNAGTHELTFLLPATMADARISTPMLRRKPLIAAIDPKAADSPLRVRLELQGDAMNDLRVLVENDRLLTPGSHTAPIPGFETAAGRPGEFVRHQYVVLETTNRDELIVEQPTRLEALSRQQQQWQTLSELLRSKRLYQAYLVQPGAAEPRLAFHLQRHEEVETAGARIDLAQTTMVVDANGAYRAKVELSLDNSSEQFLDVELPEGATLWTVHVAGEPVKPAQVPGAPDTRHVLLPVRKTAKGDLNYLVVLKYGGKMPALSLLSLVQFPLVRNVKSYPRPGNIGIEQTQLEIYVPKSHEWFDFGGTVHRTEDEADLKAGRIAAFNKLGQRLIEATRDKDPFARVRATENLKNWVAEAQKNQVDAGRVSNKALQSQISASTSTAEQARDVLKSTAEGGQQDEETIADNRDRLNDLYQKQVVVNAQGTLNLAGNNSYGGAVTVNAGTTAIQSPADFNGNWITRNNLNSETAVAQQAVPSNAPATPTVAGGGVVTLSSPAMINGPAAQNANPGLVNGRIILNSDQPPSVQGGFNNANVYWNAPGGMGGGMGGGQMGGQLPGVMAQSPGASQAAPAQQPYGRRNPVREGQQRELFEYQQKLSMANTANQAPSQAGEGMQQAQQPQSGKPASTPPAAAATPPATSAVIVPSPAKVPDAADTIAANGTVVSLAPSVPAGLASLDLDLPIDTNLYGLYRFTTPRGEAELTARTISNRTLTRLELALAFSVAGLIVWAACMLIRRGAFDWLRRPAGAALLTLLGLAFVCGGVLPVAGLIAMIAGIVLLASYFWGRRLATG